MHYSIHITNNELTSLLKTSIYNNAIGLDAWICISESIHIKIEFINAAIQICQSTLIRN